MQFLLGVQNCSKIQNGGVAILHADPTGLYTYDSLKAWKSLLADNNPTLASGLSLIIQTALPKGTVYEEESLFYSEVNLRLGSPTIPSFCRISVYRLLMQQR